MIKALETQNNYFWILDLSLGSCLMILRVKHRFVGTIHPNNPQFCKSFCKFWSLHICSNWWNLIIVIVNKLNIVALQRLSPTWVCTLLLLLFFIFMFMVFQIKPSFKGDFILDKPQAKAALLLYLSMPTLADTCSSIIPPRAFVYAVPLLGKLPASVKDAIHLDPLSIHFSQFHVSDPCPGKLCDNLLNESLMSTHTVHTRHIFSCQKDEMISCMKLIFGEVVKTWLFLKSNHSVEALKSLRCLSYNWYCLV